MDRKFIIGIAICTLVILTAAILILPKEKQQTIENANTPQNLTGDSAFTRGKKGAKVTIVEFADFQCPACAIVSPTVKQIVSEYGDGIYYIFQHFPLIIHQNAIIAAKVAEAAGEQGKFWEMQDKLFENQSQWSQSASPMNIFAVYGENLGLNIEQFKKSMESDKFLEKINTDRNYGNSLGVNSTPTFFINGKKLNGVPTYLDFKQIIEEEMNQ